MTQSRKQRFPRWPILIIVIGFVVGGIWALLGPTLAQETWYPPGFVEAKKRWDSRTFSRYRLVLEVPNLLDGKVLCAVDVDVQDEKVIQSFRNTCQSNDLLTVTGLFKLIERDTNHPERPNGPNCDAMVVHTVYNTQFGYPEKISYKQEYPTASNVPPAIYEQHKAYFNGNNPCTLLGRDRSGYVIRSLTPLPESVIF